MLKLVNISKYYSGEGNVALGLRNINIEFNLNEIVAIVGESGSGKTTLLNVISGIDSYEEGEMYFNGNETSHFSLSDWDEYRKNNIGFVFQNYNLIDSYNVLQNVETVLLLQGVNKKDARKRALEIIESVGLTSRKKTKASKLSGGEKQRTVIARAIASDSKILVCDEPTGNLDSESGKQIMALLKRVSSGRLVIIVTHDFKVVEMYATRKVRLFDGEIVEDTKLKPIDDAIVTNKINKVNKANPFINLYLALRNLINTPKRTVFSFLVYLAITAFVVGIYENILLNSLSGNGYYYNYNYQFIDNRRIIVNKTDKTAFSELELADIEKINNINKVYENDFYLDAYITIFVDFNEQGRYQYMSLYQSIDLISEDDLVAGVMPQNDDEVVISKYEYETASFIGKEVEINLGNKYKVVGEMYSSNQYYNNSLTMYGSKVVENEVKLLNWDSYYDINIENNLDGHIIEFLYNEDLNDNTIKILYNESIAFDEIENSKLYLSSYYGSDILNNITLEYETLEDLDSKYYKLELNKKTLIKLLDDKVYQLTVLTDDAYVLNAIRTKLNNYGYKTFAFSDVQNQVDAGGMLFMTIFQGVIALLAAIVLYFISYLVLSLITNSKKKDYSIFRILGADKKSLNQIIIYENLMLAIVAYLFMIIMAFIADKFYNLSVIKVIKYNDYSKLLLLFIFISLLSFFIGSRFNRKLFSSNANNSLKRE